MVFWLVKVRKILIKGKEYALPLSVILVEKKNGNAKTNIVATILNRSIKNEQREH